ncbi:magnesium transporter [Zopfochytrium polystomum]|nr:magnesium transporter [Zopfochytrium polystomum]
MRARLRDPLWIAGIILSYSGEVFGNWFALGYVSAAIVTPMGVISVLTTAILGSIILGEEITLRQRRGYVLLIAAVFGVLIVAPKGGQVLGDTAADVISFCLSPIFLCGALVIVICQSGLIYLVFGRGRFGLAELVGVCSLFGAINVTCGRIISVLVRVSASSSGDTETEPVSEEPTVLSKTSLSLAVAAVAVMIVCSIVGQEYFKQEALSRYPVSTFQPVLFAGFNTAAVLTSIVLFREIPTLIEHLVFLSVFGLCMWTVFVGSRMIEQESPADVETQKET